MKLFKKHNNLLVLFLLSTAITVSSCSTTGMQRSEDVQSSMENVNSHAEVLVGQIDAIDASLSELTRPGQQDVKRAFNSYTENVSKIKKMEKNFTSQLNGLKTKGNKYFEQWNDKDNDYENSEIQKSSDERREAFKNTFEKIQRNSEGLSSSLKTFVSNVNQIQQYMSNDLTTKGITSIASLSEETVHTGDSLKSALKILQATIQEARSEMTQSGIAQQD